MSESPYTQTAHLSDGHSKGITAVAFNAEGSLLATASLDGTVCIWNTSTWNLLDIYRPQTGVSSLVWFANDALVCGLQDGVMSSVVKDGEKHVLVSGFWAHLYPVEHLAACGPRVASGAHEELRVWDWNTNAALASLAKALPLPTDKRNVKGRADDEADGYESNDKGDDKTPALKGKGDAEVLVTGVAWAQSFLVVTYLHHGIRLYDTEHWKLVKTITTTGSIVSSSLSPNGGFLAASNLAVGFDIYDLDSEKVIRTFKHNTGDHGHAIPVLFVHGGHAILGGSMTGSISIWYVDAAQQLPPMTIPHNQKVLAIAARYDEGTDRFYIATGVMNERSSSSVIIWSSASGPGQVAMHEQWGDADDSDCKDEPARGGVAALVGDVFYFSVVVCVVAAFGFAIFMSDTGLVLGRGLEILEDGEYYD